MLRFSRIFPLILALTLVAAACTGSGDSAEPDPETTVADTEVEETDDDVAADGEPAADDDASDDTADDGDPPEDEGPLRSLDCPFSAPADVETECFEITVPENWDTGDGEVKLIVGVLPSVEDSDAEPIVYLEGGPGGHALDTLEFQYDDLWRPLAQNRTLIFFDQRGTGYSEPSLRCPALTELARTAEDDPSLDPEALQVLSDEALAGCATGFEGSGIDTSQYNTINNARDADAIRDALGYDQWNILGISYGTRLGLEMMRQFPDTIRASVLDSVYPPQVDSVLDNPQTFLDSFDAVSAACEAEPGCAAQGNLKDRFLTVAADLEATPREVDVVNLATGESDTVQATGDTIVGLIAQGLYSPVAFSDWPELLTDTEDGGTNALSAYLSLERTNEPFLTEGMFLTFQCNEEVPFADPDEIAAAGPEDPFELYDRAFDGGDQFSSCAALGTSEAEPVANQPVTSDVPSLVLAGEFDPVTPPAWGELAAETLSNSTFVTVVGESHGVSPSPCGLAMVTEFLDDPTAELNTDCAAEGRVFFVESPEEPIETEVVNADFAVGQTAGLEIGQTQVRQPVGWTNTNVNGLLDSRRVASLLDVAQVLQFAGSPEIRTAIEAFITTNLEVELAPNDEPIDEGWEADSGDNGRISVDLYQRPNQVSVGDVDVVMMISSVSERDALRSELLIPILEGFGS